MKKQLDEWKVKAKDRVMRDLGERVYNLPRQPINVILADPEKGTVYKVTNGGEGQWRVQISVDSTTFLHVYLQSTANKFKSFQINCFSYFTIN